MSIIRATADAQHLQCLAVYQIYEKKKKKEKMATENIWKATGSKLAKDARQELSAGHESHDDGLKLVVVLWAVY